MDVFQMIAEAKARAEREAEIKAEIDALPLAAQIIIEKWQAEGESHD